jgi:hypothetical protein
LFLTSLKIVCHFLFEKEITSTLILHRGIAMAELKENEKGEKKK